MIVSACCLKPMLGLRSPAVLEADGSSCLRR